VKKKTRNILIGSGAVVLVVIAALVLWGNGWLGNSKADLNDVTIEQHDPNDDVAMLEASVEDGKRAQVELDRRKEAEIVLEMSSPSTIAIVRSTENSFNPKFNALESGIKSNARGIEANGRGIGRLEKNLAGQSHKKSALLKFFEGSPVLATPVVAVQRQPASSRSSTSHQQSIGSTAGMMKIVVTGVSGNGEFWGPMTDWTENKQPLVNGVGEFNEQSGVGIWINGRIGNSYLTDIVLVNSGRVKLIASNGQEYTFVPANVVADAEGRNNLSFTYIQGRFQ
jgi:hypothetical protein